MGEGFSDGKPSIEVKPEFGDKNVGNATEGQPFDQQASATDTLEPGSEAVKKLFSEATQRHHDYYVGLHQMGQLPEHAKSNYELAMQREQDGEVKPYSLDEGMDNK